jgi:hypothetical protein
VTQFMVAARGVLLRITMLLGLKPIHTCDSITCLSGVCSFTYTTIHHATMLKVHAAALFPDPVMMNAVLAVEPYMPQHTTTSSTATTPMHVAAYNGNVKLIAPLIKNGHSTDQKDRWGRTPLDIACLQQWSTAETVAAFGDTAPAHCQRLRMSASTFSNENRLPASGPFHYSEAGGGYMTGRGHSNEGLPSTCDFDVVEAMTTSEFQQMYASARRPVLVRGALRGARCTHSHT